MLRPYQVQAVEEIRQQIKKNIRKILLWMETGSGKTVVFCEILKGVANKNTRAVMVAYGEKLIDQASQRLIREGVEHGVIQGNHCKNDPNAKIQVCSISTLYKRRYAPPADIIIIDECDQATAPGYLWLLSQYQPTTVILGVTATPYAKKGLRHIADVVVHPITYIDLVKQNFLKPLRYYAPTVVDLKGVKKQDGDYNTDDLHKAMSKATIFADIVGCYKSKAYPRPAIAFATNIKHSEEIADRFNSAGIPAAHVEADTPTDERNNLISQLESGEIKVLSSCGILTRGVDIPCVSALIMARPTKSYNLYQQMLGRGTRPTPLNSDCLVLDHANNIKEHGFKENERPPDLDPAPKKQKGETEKTITCKQCYYVFPYIDSYICPDCGHDNSPPTNGPRNTKEFHGADLEEVMPTCGPIDFVPPWVPKDHRRFVSRRIKMASDKGYKPYWIVYKYQEITGRELEKHERATLVRAVKLYKASRFS